MTSCTAGYSSTFLMQNKKKSAARNLAASDKRSWTRYEPLFFKHTLWKLSTRPDIPHVISENIYKSLPTVTVIAGPNPVHCGCGWYSSKTHKPTHIPEHVSLPCLHKTIMSEIFLCSLNTWSLQFGEMAAWLSVLRHVLTLSYRLVCQLSLLTLCNYVNPQCCARSWDGLILIIFPFEWSEAKSLCSVKDRRGKSNQNISQKRISAVQNVLLSVC